MMVAPLPEGESERLAELMRHGVLDTPPEERFDRITRLVSAELGVPISLVSLVDKNRQWFKSKVGLDATETPRDVAFCAHAILGDEMLIVQNAAEDPRFCDNPLVVEGPEIRFYAGAPLVTPSGHRLGTLCAIDSEPRKLSAREENLLREMAAIVVDEMELSAATKSLDEQATKLEERNGALDAFVHALSHDLAGPIRRIKSFCELISSESSVPLESALEAILGSAVTADQLLQDLRSFFVVEKALGVDDCDVRMCVDEALDALADEVRETSARVVFTGPLPQVRFHRGLLAILFGNLIGNAIKYRGDGVPEIKIGARDDDDFWEFSIADNGIGIPEAHQQAVFELLVRLHRAAEIPGSGMGLAICKKIVQRGGGAIRLESTEGQGTRILFTIPKDAPVELGPR